MLCTERTLVKHSGNTLTASPLRCRCWSCDHCAPQRCKRLRAEARKGRPTIFLTLTIRRGRYATPDAQAQALAEGWRMLRQFLCRQLGWKSIPFLAVIEKHKSGWPHLHLLLRCTFIHHALIRRWWTERFASPMIFINRLTSESKAVHYITKYLAKAPQVFEGCKRYWSSRDYQIPDPEEKPVEFAEDVWWEAITLTVQGVIRAAHSDGALVECYGSKAIISRWFPLDRQRWGLK